MRAVAAILTLLVFAVPATSAAQTAIRPDKVIHLFDGKSLDSFYTWVVNEGYRSSLTGGKILIQSEGAEIFFRRIDLEPLEKK